MDRVQHAGDASASELGVGEVGWQAAEAIRALNHLTQPAAGALSDPGDAAQVAAALASLTGRLPQLLRQIGRWLAEEQRAGRLRVDALSPSPDAAAATDATLARLRLATQYAGDASVALDAAHQQLAHLAPRPELSAPYILSAL
jgi:hypothetical protein